MRCNNGWMSSVESDAKPLLLPLIKGEAFLLSKADVATISKWIALKIIISEHENPKNQVTPREDREKFMRDGVVPSYFDIRIANHSCTSQVGFFRKTWTILVARGESPPKPREEFPVKNIQDVHFIIGSLLVVGGASRSNIRIGEMFNVVPDALPRIWPLPEGRLSWPPQRVLVNPQIQMLLKRVDTFLNLSRPKWCEHPSEPLNWSAKEPDP